MGKRVGIELSPLACRIVELDGDVPETRVQRYAIVPTDSEEMSAMLASLRRRDAAVVVWGVASDHRQVVVRERGYEDMRAEAIAAVREAGVQTEGMTADIARVGSAGDGSQAVVLALAATPDLAAAVSPLVDAGVRVRSVVTPADALASLARTRRAFSVPGAVEAYVALEETTTSVALVRDGVLLSACELSWGYLEADRTKRRRRDDVALQLADDLRAFFSTVGAAPGSVRQLLICGGLPELRSMTVPLMERLDLEVEPLDSLIGIDEARLPEPAGDFRERAAEWRLAWAVAADRLAPINLMRPRRRLTARSSLARTAAAAGVVAGLGLGWRIEQSQWLDSIMNSAPRSAPKPVAGITPPSPSLSGRGQTPPASAPAPAPARQTAAASLPTVPPAPRPTQLPAPGPAQELAPPPRASVAVEAPRVVTSPPRTSVAVEAPRVVASLPPPVEQRSPRADQAAPRANESAGPRPPATPPSLNPRPVPTARAASAPEAAPLPFDAALAMILYSSDRQLAIIDGRIVGAGDEVKGARIVEITPNAVLLRDAQGRLRSLALGASG